MQCFCNNIYDNAHNIISWDTNKEKNNVESEPAVTVDYSDVGTGLCITSKGGLRVCRVLTHLYPDASRGNEQITQQHTTQQRHWHGHGHRQEIMTQREDMYNY